MVQDWGPSASLWCWQIGHSAGAVASSALVRLFVLSGEWPGGLPEFLPAGSIFLYHCPLRVSQEGALELPTFGQCSHIMPEPSVTRMGFLFLHQLVVGNSREAISSGWETEGSLTGMGAVGVWATFSCSSPVPSGQWLNVKEGPPKCENS